MGLGELLKTKLKNLLDSSRPRNDQQPGRTGSTRGLEASTSNRWPDNQTKPGPSGGAHLFQGAQNVVISGGNLTAVGGNYFQTVNNFTGPARGHEESELYAALNPVAAAHNCQEVTAKVSQCFEGTRRQLLRQIETWRTSGDAPIFILDGIAGIGKTTVAKTVSVHAAEANCLAASFFFSRDSEKRRTTRWFIPTIAYQLSRYHPVFFERIMVASRENPDVLQKDIRLQFMTLIQKPLYDLLQEGGPHTISIDAFDECRVEEAVVLLSILFEEVPKLPGLRIFLTCRPERAFRILFQKHGGPRRIFHLQDIEDSVVQSDIRRYIDHRLSSKAVQEALPDLQPPVWQPSAREKDGLVRMAGKLFIIASTSINFVLDTRRLAPAKQLQKILQATAGKTLNPMDALYTQVLQSAIPDPPDGWFDEYQESVGSIVLLADVLPADSLAQLLGIAVNDIIGTLSNLHSLLSPPEHNHVFRIHHKSFPDFVTDKTRCSIDPRFYINPAERHLHLAERCLQVMDVSLRQNICDLSPDDWDKDLEDLQLNPTDQIPEELAYACIYWSFHLEQSVSGCSLTEIIPSLLYSFVSKHLLSWLEVLAFVGRFDAAWSSLNNVSAVLNNVLSQSGADAFPRIEEILELLQDGLRFVSMHPDIPRCAPMHLYISSLPFVPCETKLHRLYNHLLPPKTAAITSGIERSWDPVSATLLHAASVSAIAFSPTAPVIATLSDHIRLWDTRTGGLLRELPRVEFSKFQDGAQPQLVTFSQYGDLVAGADIEGVWVWDASSGNTLSILETATGKSSLSEQAANKRDAIVADTRVTSVAFSLDRTKVTCGTKGGSILIWKMGEGIDLWLEGKDGDEECGCPPGPHKSDCFVFSIDFVSPISEDQLLVARSPTSVQFWDLKTATRNGTVTRPKRDYHARLPFSPDGRLVVLPSDSTFAITTYNLNSSAVTTLTGHEDIVHATAFSSDGLQLFSSSDDKTVRLWDLKSGTQISCTPHPTVYRQALFSRALQDFILEDREWIGKYNQGNCGIFGPPLYARERNATTLSLDGSVLAVQDGDQSLFTLLCNLLLPTTLSPRPDGPNVLSTNAIFCPDGQMIAGSLVNGIGNELQLVGQDGTESLPTRFPVEWTPYYPENLGECAIAPDYSNIAFSFPRSAFVVCCLDSRHPREPLLLETDPSDDDSDSDEDDKGSEGDDSDEDDDSDDDDEEPIMVFSPEGTALVTKWFGKTPIYVWKLDATLDGGTTQTTDLQNLHVKPIKIDSVRSEKVLHILFAPDNVLIGVTRSRNIWELEPFRSADRTQTPIPVSEDVFSVSGVVSQDGSRLALAMKFLGDRTHTEPVSMTIWSRPSYEKLANLSYSYTIYTELHIKPSFPTILVSRTIDVLAVWDMDTLEKTGEFFPQGHYRLSIWDFFPLSPTEYLVLVRRHRPSAMGLLALEFHPSRGAMFKTLFWLPPHFKIWHMSVNPVSPVVMFSGGKTMYYTDISKFKLPYYEAIQGSK